MEKINLVELLKDCPKGMELDCAMFEDVFFDEITNNKIFPICIKRIDGHPVILTKYGGYANCPSSKCVIFPKGKTTWEGFVPPCKFKDGDIIFTHTNASKGLLEDSWVSIFKEYRNNRCACYVCLCLSDLELYHDKWEDGLLCELCEIEEYRLATEEEKEKLFNAIKENSYKWNAETKTLEKLPKFKVGDKVLAFGNKWTIVDAVWDGSIEEVVYIIKSETSGYTTTKLSNQLQPYKEEAMDKAIKAVFDAKVQCCDIMNDIIKKDMKEIKIDIPAGYEFAGVDDNAQQVVFAKIQPEYPKTYEECCKILGVPSNFELRNQTIQAWYIVRLSFFQQLLICLNAYWEIAGEQMGLGKPWEPDWEDETEIYHTISYDGVNIKCYNNTDLYSKLAFPTKEMRDAFYENFKELINQCKELL